MMGIDLDVVDLLLSGREEAHTQRWCSAFLILSVAGEVAVGRVLSGLAGDFLAHDQFMV